MDSSSGKMLDNGIAYIQITTFGSKTTPQLLAALKDIMAKHPKGIILDLRNNGGGYFQTAGKVALQFLDKGAGFFEKNGGGSRTKHDIIPRGKAKNKTISMVVIVNEGSAPPSAN